MSETSTPWRALEDATETRSGDATPGSRGQPARAGRLPPWWLIASLGLAAVLVTAAVLLIVSSGGGAVTVVGDSVGDIGVVVAESGRSRRGAPSAGADLI